MRYHVLNGDAIADQFPVGDIEGRTLIIREAFSEGPLSLTFDKTYWKARVDYLSDAYEAQEEDYAEQFLGELKKLEEIKEGDEIFLWFEDDLFCLINMLFVIYYLPVQKNQILYRVFPVADPEHWIGFAKARKKDLLVMYHHAIRIDADEIALARQLWEAFVENDFEKLKALSFSESQVFRFLPQVIEAHIARFPLNGELGRPQQTLTQILMDGQTDFYEIFESFWKKDAIYGFGDLQIYNMLRKMEVQFTGDAEN
jgi:hypothetical protein